MSHHITASLAVLFAVFAVACGGSSDADKGPYLTSDSPGESWSDFSALETGADGDVDPLLLADVEDYNGTRIRAEVIDRGEDFVSGLSYMQDVVNYDAFAITIAENDARALNDLDANERLGLNGTRFCVHEAHDDTGTLLMLVRGFRSVEDAGGDRHLVLIEAWSEPRYDDAQAQQRLEEAFLTVQGSLRVGD